MYSGKVNQVVHASDAQIRSGVGDWCHYKEAWFPAFVVTDLENNILLDNSAPDPTQPKWVITGARVMVTRFWSASTAYISATVHLPDLGTYPPPPPRSLTYESQFRIWAGHLDRPRQVKPEDLGEGSENGRLLPVFLGSVDTYALHCTSEGGYTYTIQARDRMKWFMDTQITYNLGEELQTRGDDDIQLTRSDIIHGALARGIGDMTTVLSDTNPNGACRQVCSMGLPADVNNSFDVGANKADAGAGQSFPADYFYRELDFLSGRTELSEDDAAPEPEPLFRFYVTRQAPEIDFSDAVSIIFERKTPLEIVKQMALQEIYPIEVFQDHRSGHIYYTPRASDGSALPESYGGGGDSGGDPKRFFRTYFFRNYPDGYNPDINQMLIAFKEEQSSLGMYNNFIVNKPNDSGEPGNQFSVVLATKPWGFPENTPCRFYVADDTTLQTADEAAAIAVQLARIFSRETRAGVAVMLGDPSFVPGEIIQVVGSPNMTDDNDEAITSSDGMAEIMSNNRAVFHDFNNSYNQQLPRDYIPLSLGAEPAEGEAAAPAEPGQYRYPSEEDEQEYNPYQVENPEDQSSGDKILCSMRDSVRTADRHPPTIWRVEGIMHKYSYGEGYTTELALASAF